MANNNNNESSTKAKPVKSSGWLINLLGFAAVILIGFSLLFSKVGIADKISAAFKSVADIISYLVLILISFFFVWRRRKNIWLWVVWVIAVVLIVVFYFI